MPQKRSFDDGGRNYKSNWKHGKPQRQYSPTSSRKLSKSKSNSKSTTSVGQRRDFRSNHQTNKQRVSDCSSNSGYDSSKDYGVRKSEKRSGGDRSKGHHGPHSQRYKSKSKDDKNNH